MKGNYYFDDQKVTWQAIAQKHNKKKGKWVAVKKSDIHESYTDSTRNAFEDSGTFDQIFGLSAGRYRVNIQMNWYDPKFASTLEGSATHRVNYYKHPLLAYEVKQNYCKVSAGDLVGGA